MSPSGFLLLRVGRSDPAGLPVVIEFAFPSRPAGVECFELDVFVLNQHGWSGMKLQGKDSFARASFRIVVDQFDGLVAIDQVGQAVALRADDAFVPVVVPIITRLLERLRVAYLADHLALTGRVD